MHMEPNSERSPCTQKKSTASSLSHSKRPRLSFPQENLGQLKKRKLKIMKENTLLPLDRPDLCASLFHREFLKTRPKRSADFYRHQASAVGLFSNVFNRLCASTPPQVGDKRLTTTGKFFVFFCFPLPFLHWRLIKYISRLSIEPQRLPQHKGRFSAAINILALAWGGVGRRAQVHIRCVCNKNKYVRLSFKKKTKNKVWHAWQVLCVS